MKPTTIAVTGASGHIGNVVCRQLLEKGHQVKALYQANSESLQGLPVSLVQGSVLDKSDLKRLIEGCSVVIHCAAIISIDGDPSGIVFKTNTEGPENVLELCLALGVKKLIHLSSVHAVMEIPMAGAFDETRPYKTAAAFAYDYSKAQGEQRLLRAVKDSSLELVILRPSSVVGPFDFKPSKFGKALLDFYNQKIPILPPGGYDFVDVRDVAQSVVAAIDQGKNGEIYLLAGKYYSMKQLAGIIRKASAQKTPNKQIPFWVLKLCLPLISLFSRISGAAPLFTIESISALKYGHPNMDHSKADRELGHQCRDLEATIRDFYEWIAEKNNPV